MPSAGCSIVVQDRADAAVLGEQRIATVAEQVQVERLVRLLLAVALDHDGDGLRGLAGGEGQGATGGLVVAAGGGGAVRGGVGDGERLGAGGGQRDGEGGGSDARVPLRDGNVVNA